MALTKQELETVRSFAEVFIEGSNEVITPSQVAANIDNHLQRVDSSRIKGLKLTLFVIEHVLPRVPWPFRARFSKLSPAERKRVIEKHLQNRRSTGLVRDLARIRTLFALGYYGDARVHASVGFIPVPERPKYLPDKLKRLGLPPLTLHTPPGDRIECDVCVIGSGAGGAVVAYHAAAAGRDVVVLEEGPYTPAEELNHDEAAMTAKLYKEGGLQTTVDLDMAILQGKCLGGSTVINNAICFRLEDPRLGTARPPVLATWKALGAHIDPANLIQSFDRVERMINVRDLLQSQDPAVPPIDGNNARVLLKGWDVIASQDPDLGSCPRGLFRKNYERCLGCGYCNFGCPYERKMSMLETYLPAAIREGARVVVGCHALEIVTSAGRATGVRCKLRDGRDLLVTARSIIVACGAIGSSILLLKSGIKRNVGTRFTFNAGTPVLARFPTPLQSFDGLQMASYVDAGEYLLESLFYPPMTFAITQSGWFREHFERMAAYDHFACAGVLIGTEPNARIKHTGIFREAFGPIEYEMTSADLQKLKRGIARLSQLFLAAGAESVYPSTFVSTEIRAQPPSSYEAILKMLDERIRKPEDVTLSSAHPQGGNPMSDDPSVGVVDSQFRVHRYANLFVCDASVFPSTIYINPQVTIMALADYFSHLGVL